MSHGPITRCYLRPIHRLLDLDENEPCRCSHRGCKNAPTDVYLFAYERDPPHLWRSKLVCDKHADVIQLLSATTLLKPSDLQ